MRFKFIKVTNAKITVFEDVTLCSLADKLYAIYRENGGNKFPDTLVPTYHYT
jgi:hypothetical protein